ncbi:MAG: SsrA-binding protein SmpB [Armatimonadota bacterium]|nr:SsrA-binding protein SmpB [Armatimonadota bacterium]MDR7422924.1 SsrA-binding protein SmpB [Armatimonadota bacterium]MDR7454694.1 SsrA-binding protein SmpB [Armatimonadota bacterium]MDR7456329.1 SsrA-binding protein SmpB [Armatimonadota bacterium]MDR7496731.1 SsrA-binding protein SmpB [Armatimonadota bacterium]
MPVAEGEKLVATNRRARHEYHIEEAFEAGLVLTGTEVKALRAGRASLAEAYARVEGGEVWLHHLHIPPYEAGNIFNHDPLRRRKLLLHRRQIERLAGRAAQKGYTLVPLRLYFTRGRAKVEIALARGKKLYDKRAAIGEREAGRQARRAVKHDVTRQRPQR